MEIFDVELVWDEDGSDDEFGLGWVECEFQIGFFRGDIRQIVNIQGVFVVQERGWIKSWRFREVCAEMIEVL